MFQAALAAFGRVDILMSNASADASGTYVADLQIEDFERTLRSNLIGQLICSKHFINHRKQVGGGGEINNMTSVHQEQPRAGAADYDCSKGALRNPDSRPRGLGDGHDREQHRSGHGAHPFQPESDRRPGHLGEGDPKHSTQARCPA